jgi:NitT/TauT family transport system permease protein
MSKKTTKQFTSTIAWKNLWQTIVALAFLLLLWVVAHVAVGNDLLVPSVGDCLKEMGRALTDGGFWHAFLHTLLRVIFAFGISFVLALIFALIAYMVPWFGRFLSPIVSMLRSLPTLAVLLVLLVWAGAAKAPVIVAFMSLFPMLYAGMTAALLQVDEELLEMSRVYHVPLKKRVLNLYLPSMLPYVLREASAAFSFSLKLVVSAEVLANTYKSLGGMMQESRLYLEMPTLFALVALTFLFGLVLEFIGIWTANFVERRVK